MPSRNVLIGSTVDNSTIATIQIQPAPAASSSDPLTAPVSVSVTAAPLATSALNSHASMRPTTTSATRM